METKKIGNFEISDVDLQTFIARLPQEQQMYAQMPEFREQCEKRLEEIALFAVLAEESGLEESDEFKITMAAARRDILSQLGMTQVLRDINVTEDDAKAYFEEHKAEYMTKPTANAKHILVDSEEKANEIKSKIEAGEISFEDAAREHSSCPSKEKGGDLGQFSPGQMVPEFDQAVFSAEVDQLIGPVQTQFGQHLIVVTAKSEAKEAEYEAVKNQVMQAAILAEQDKTYQAKCAELRAKYL